MNYKFPIIQHINDVLPAIKDAPEFIVAEKDGYTVLSYFMTNPNETFPSVVVPMSDGKNFKYNEPAALRRECRGLIFCSRTGLILSRGYHKFFNITERDETTDIDLSKPHVILEKLDGSMIRPLFLGKHKRPRWITKMGVTEVSMQVETWLAENPDLQERYERYVAAENGLGCTPIFEWCSRKQRIVLDYPQDQLILTAIRINKTGEYFSYNHIVDTAKKFNIPVVRIVENEDIMNGLAEHVEEVEGWVVRFDDGHMVKVKTNWYVLRHKALDGLRSEKNVLKLYLDEGLDDVMPLLDDSTKQKLEEYVRGVNINVTKTGKIINTLVEGKKDLTNMTRKEFAAWVQSTVLPYAQSIYFKVWDGDDACDAVLDKISRNLQSQNTVDAIRPLIGANWNAAA